MPRFLFLAALLMLSAPVVMADPIAGSSTLSCNYEFKRPATEGVAEIEVKDGRIQKISFGNFFYGAEGKLGYTCEIEGARGDGETRWVDKKGRTIVELPDPGEYGSKNTMTIIPRGTGYLLDLRDTGSGGRCGTGAGLPRSVFVPAASKTCKVELWKY